MHRSPLARARDLGVQVKIVAAVTVAALVALLVGVIGIVALARTNAATGTMYTEQFVGIAELATMRRATVEMRLNVTNQALSLDDAATRRYEALVADNEAEVRDAIDTTRTLELSEEEHAAVEDFEALLEEYVQVRDDRMLPAGAAGDLVAWTQARDDSGEILTGMSEALSDLVTDHEEAAAAAAATAASSYASSRTLVVSLLVVGLVSALALGLAVARAIVRDVGRVRAVAAALEAGDLTTTSGLTTDDEVGQMGRALDNAVSTLRRLIGTIDQSSDALAAASEQLSASSVQIAASAEETSAQAGVVSAAAHEVTRHVQTVAAGTEQMGASIQEIASNASQASQVARRAVAAAAETGTTMSRLGDSSRAIGNVVKMITSIAEQTNLLALNATIEAARAGEAGKGFAVVAGEVKELASETAKATEDIARRVDAIQDDVAGAVAAIEQINEVIGSISDYQMTIASAVEEQTATTGEMTRSVVEAATGSGEIAQNISSVAGAADLTSQGATDTQGAVAELVRMSASLKDLVGGFRV